MPMMLYRSCPLVLLGCLLLFCAPTRGVEVSLEVPLRADDLVGYYEWTQAVALVTPLTEGDEPQNPFLTAPPAVEQSLSFPVKFDDYFGLRVFQRELEPSNRFFIMGSIAEGNDFVLSLELLDDNSDNDDPSSTTTSIGERSRRLQLFQEPYWTAYRCRSAANPPNCEKAKIENSVFQLAVEPVVAALSQITLNDNDGTLVLEGPAGRLVGVRQMQDPLFVQPPS